MTSQYDTGPIPETVTLANAPADVRSLISYCNACHLDVEDLRRRRAGAAVRAAPDSGWPARPDIAEIF